MSPCKTRSGRMTRSSRRSSLASSMGRFPLTSLSNSTNEAATNKAKMKKRRSSIACAASLSSLDALKRAAGSPSVNVDGVPSRVSVLVRCRPLSEKERLNGAFEVVEPLPSDENQMLDGQSETTKILYHKASEEGCCAKVRAGSIL